MVIERSKMCSMPMSAEVWQRHASPWSVWSRIATFPALMLALWSPHWLGWWAVIPGGLLAAWIWLNPRLFTAPASTDNWASKATFGERIWLNRATKKIPNHHALAATILATASGIGAVVMLAGTLASEPVCFSVGGAVCFICKLWFCDRMVWLYDDMKDADAEYAGWLRG